MSDTPRTDAVNNAGHAHYMALELARTLERELAAAQAEIVNLLSQDSEATQRMAERLAAAQARIASLEETIRVVNVEAALAGEEKARLDARLARLHDDYAESMRIKESEIVRLSGLVKKLEENQCEEEPSAWHLTDSTHGLSMFHTYKPKGGTPLYRKKNHE